MKFKFVYLFILLAKLLVSCSSSQKIAVNYTHDQNKWGKAVLNIESLSDKYNIYEILSSIGEKKKLNKGYNYQDSINDYNQLRKQIKKVSGTAIYIYDGDNKYLITAKHVVYDENFTLRHLYFTKENLNIRSREYFEKLNSNISIKTPLSLFLKGRYNTFEIPEVNQDSASRPFKFSNDDLDIAIISLQSKMTFPLRKLLDEDGYIPLNVNDIDTSDNLSIGDELIAIGYPSFSKLGKVQEKQGVIDEDVVLPLVTFGKIAMYHPILDYFVADITVNPGNSGGPIIRNNKIIGIVSKQMLVNLSISPSVDLEEVITNIKSSSPLAKIIKAKHILLMLKYLKEIENNKIFLRQELSH